MISQGPVGAADGPRRIETTLCFELVAGLPAEQAEKRLAGGLRCGDVGARATAFYLADLAERGAHQELGYRSIIQYAEQRHGMSRATAHEYLRVGRALEELPLIDEALCGGRLCWSQARLLVTIATPETETAWIDWARQRSAREVTAHVANRDKGQRPSDPAKRRIHTTTFAVRGRFNAAGLERWNTARARREAELGVALSDTDMLLDYTRLVLAGAAAGRGGVNPADYTVIVHHIADDGTTMVRTDEGPLRLDAETARAVLREAGREDLAAGVPDEPPADDEFENAGPDVPPGQRDRPTPAKLRRRVLARDGTRCRCCGRRIKPAGHHKKELAKGGRTEEANLATLCDGCHSLDHDGLLVLRGSVEGRLAFTDRNGRDLRGRAAAGGPALKKVSARADTPAVVSFNDLPGEADAAWFERHRHLFKWSGASLAFSPGLPCEPENGEKVSARADTSGPTLDSIVGQKRVVGKLKLAVRASARSGERVPHTLLCGPPGLGKTTLALAVANEAGRACRRVSAPTIEDPGMLLKLLTSLADRDVLFIDEIHRLPHRVAETLYEATAEGAMSLQVTCGQRVRCLHVQTPRFTLFGATTDEDRMLPALFSRFGIRQRLAFYGPQELAELVTRAATGNCRPIHPGAAAQLARYARQSPREALALLDAARDEAIDAGAAGIDRKHVAAALERLGIDADGLAPHEREYLDALARARGPVGLSTLAAQLGVSRKTLRGYEGYLIRRGLVAITRQGRVRVSASPPGTSRAP